MSDGRQADRTFGVEQKPAIRGTHRLANKIIKTEILDWIIVVIGLTLFVAFALLRLFVFRVRY